MERGDSGGVGFFDESLLTAVRLALALGGLGLALGWERLRPFRRTRSNRRHELTNLGLWALNAAVLQIAGATALFGAAYWAASRELGVLAWLDLPRGLAVLATVLVLDLVTYALHRLYHAQPLLWRIHRVHHSDRELAATTGVRFHTGEVLLSALLRLPVIVGLGADPIGVAVFEACLLLASQLQHADVRLPDRLDRSLRRILVTPNLHRIHHSRVRSEADSNYGTIVTWWDRAFRSFRTDPAPEEIEPGLEGFEREFGLPELLRMPLASERWPGPAADSHLA